jgi:hypothetical protein
MTEQSVHPAGSGPALESRRAHPDRRDRPELAGIGASWPRPGGRAASANRSSTRAREKRHTIC